MKLHSMLFVSVTTVIVMLWHIGVISEAIDEDLFNIQCNDMSPINYDPKPLFLKHNPCPVKLVVETSPVVPGDLVNITLISSSVDMPFKAFMVQARDKNETVLGTFLSPCEQNRNSTYFQVINCTDGPDLNNTVIQLYREFIPSVRITWFAPVTLNDSIRFSFTVVHDELNYWVNQKSDEVPVSSIMGEEYTVKTFIRKNSPDWYMEQLYQKNCEGPL